ncbi:glycosyltransferase family 2 protein [Fodinibius roseus]|nr:hypothetical protein [Fodinibius roseus]
MDVTTRQVDSGKILVYSHRDQTSKLLEASEVQLLLSCRKFDTLTGHAKVYFRQHKLMQLTNPEGLVGKLFRSLLHFASKDDMELPVRQKEIKSIRQRLQKWVEEGWLVSERELQQEITTVGQQNRTNSSVPERIAVMGIPTRNRPKLLTRCLKSHLKNLHRHQRECTILIVDDSDEQACMDANRQAVGEMCRRYQLPFHWIDRTARYSFANVIAKISGAPIEVVRFGLLGDLRCGIRTGASRNTLLLLAAGELSLQVDDDTICNIVRPPDSTDGIALSSEAECNQYWYYDNLDQALAQSYREEGDILSLHEALLGKHPAQLIEQHDSVKIDHLGNTLLKKLEQPEATVAFTMAGALGDWGMHRHWPRLGSEGRYQRLVENPDSYRDYLRTRQLFRGINQPTISDGMFCISMHIGLDTSELLPPFMPVQRSSDGIFGRLIHSCFPSLCQAYLSHGIVHAPIGRPEKVDISQALGVGPLRSPDILKAILLAPAQLWPIGEDLPKNLQTIGSFFSDLSQYPIFEFKMRVKNYCIKRLQMQMNYLQQCLDQRWDAPEYWKKDVKRVISNFQELMIQEDMCIPCDLPGTPEERMVIFRDLLGKFGRLLIHWPAIWEAAVQIREKQGLYTEIIRHEGIINEKDWDGLRNTVSNQMKKHVDRSERSTEDEREEELKMEPYLSQRQSNKVEVIHGMMATYPARKTQLLNTIESIMDQVQGLFIYLNEYSVEEYEELRKTLPDKCVLLWDREEAGNLMDSGKFYMSDKLKGYHLVLDDDLRYPSDFVERMVGAHQKLKESRSTTLALGMHGRKIQTFPLHSYFEDTEAYHFQRGLKHHTKVDILGTGGVLFHRGDLDMCLERCKSHGMADIWFSISCLKQGLERYVIAHPAGWVQQQPVENSLYQQHLGNDQQHTEILNSFDWDSETRAERDTNSSD